MSLSLHVSDWTVITVYIGAIVAMGFWFSLREKKTSEDFLLGGRKMPWLAVGISFMMSLFSTYSLVMVPGEIFNHGVSLFVMGALVYPFMLMLGFSLFVKFYFKLKSFTPFEYLERRYDRSVRVLVSLIYLWTRLLYLGMVLYTTALVFKGGAGWAPWLTISVVGVIAIVYTVTGGLKAVIWTDVIQFLILAVGMIWAVTLCARLVDGGLPGILSYSFEHGRGPSLYTRPEFYTINPYMRLCFWFLLLGPIMESFFYTSADQISIQRLLSTSSYRNARRAIVANAFMVIPFMLILWMIGFSIFSYYGQHPDPRVTSGDTAFFTFISTKLPSPLPGIFFAAMLAAAMSTLDSGMNSLAAVFVKEFYVPVFNKSASEANQLASSRWATVVVGLIFMGLGLVIAVSAEALRQSVVEAVTIFNALLVVMVPTYLLGVTTRRATATLVWRLAFLSWGLNFGTITWYTASRTGTTGPIPLLALVPPLAATAAVYAIGRVLRRRRGSRFIRMGALLPFGYTLSVLAWYCVPRATGGGALSFQWAGIFGLLAFFVIGYASVCFMPVQAAVKTRGLTLWDAEGEID
ncbi:MAG: sodium/solute symporter [Lentisphaerae bacterium]|nr:sodium/solute symporter [Lentisphaerota bacterium]